MSVYCGNLGPEKLILSSGEPSAGTIYPQYPSHRPCLVRELPYGINYPLEGATNSLNLNSSSSVSGGSGRSASRFSITITLS